MHLLVQTRSGLQRCRAPAGLIPGSPLPQLKPIGPAKTHHLAWNRSLADEVASLKPDLVVLAGFMRVLGAPLLDRFPGQIINVHPALLPSFPGHNGPQDALDGGVRISGCTVHIVDAGVDTGPILAQAAVPVLANDTAETLHARIQIQEHQILPRVIHQIAIGAITLDPLTVSTSVANPARSLSVPDV